MGKKQYKPVDAKKLKVCKLQAVSRRESYYMDDVDDGHTGYVIYAKDLHSGLAPAFAITLDDQRKARRSLRFLLKRLGLKVKIKGAYRHARKEA